MSTSSSNIAELQRPLLDGNVVVADDNLAALEAGILSGARMGSLPSFWNDFKMISSAAWPLAASYTFSLKISAIGVLARFVSEDEAQQAAISLLQSMVYVVIALSVAHEFALTFPIARLSGQERSQPNNAVTIRREIATHYQGGLTSAMLLTPITMLPLIWSKGILVFLGQNPEVSATVQEFTRLYSPVPFLVLMRICEEQLMFGRGQQHARNAAYMAVPTFIVSTALAAWLSVRGVGNEPWGLKGIAVAYATEDAVVALLYGLYIKFNKDFADLPLSSIRNINWRAVHKAMLQLWKDGINIMISLGIEISVAFVLGVLSGLEGLEQQAIMSLVMQPIFAFLIPALAFATISSQEMSRAIGAENYDRASVLARRGAVITTMNIAPLCFIVAIAPEVVSVLMGNDADISERLKILVPIIAAGVLADSFRYNFLYVLRAVHDWFGSTVTSNASLVLGLGLATVLGLATEADVYGIGVGYSVGMLGAAFALFWRVSSRVSPQAIESAQGQRNAAEGSARLTSSPLLASGESLGGEQQATSVNRIEHGESSGASWYNSAISFFGSISRRVSNCLLGTCGSTPQYSGLKMDV